MNIPTFFFGSPEFVVPVLKTLSEIKELKLIGVVTTHPQTPVAQAAQRLNLPIFSLEELKTIPFDLGFVAAYGKIIPKSLLEIPKFGFLNLHPSLLPKYRGPTPGQAAIFNGDKVSGITLMKLDAGMDTGAIIKNVTIKIENGETGESFYKKAFEEGSALLKEVLPDYLAGKIKPKPQDNSQATYTKLLTREDGKIDWKRSPEEIEQMIRAYSPWPGTWTTLSEITKKQKTTNKQVKVLKAHLGSGSLVIDQVQIEGKKPIGWEEFKRGYLVTSLSSPS